MRDHIRPYAGEATTPESVLRADPDLDATFARLKAMALGSPSGAALWAQFHAEVRVAQVARYAMRDGDASQQNRDLAAVAYGRHCDRVMDLLEAMSEQQLLVEVGQMLNRRGR